MSKKNKIKNIFAKVALVITLILGLLIGIVVLVYGFLIGYIFIGDPYLASKAKKIIPKQVMESGAEVKIVDFKIWEGRRVWRLLIDDVYVYLQANPSFINDNVQLNVINVIDKDASKECLESMWVKNRLWTIGVDYNEFAQKTGFKFSHVSEVANNLPKIINTIRNLEEVDKYPGKENIYINYNCKYRII